jgi:hypothetical protein
MVQTLAAAGELQRDLQRELTYDGLRAAEAKGSKGGRRPAVPADKTDTVRTAYLENRSIAALARDHSCDQRRIDRSRASRLFCQSEGSHHRVGGLRVCRSLTLGVSAFVLAPRKLAQRGGACDVGGYDAGGVTVERDRADRSA